MDLKKLSRTHVNPHSPPLHTHHCWSCPENNNNMFACTLSCCHLYPLPVCVVIRVSLVAICCRWQFH